MTTFCGKMMNVNRGSNPQDASTSHIDRDTVARRLAAAAGDGLISTSELEQRLEQAHEASTYPELQKLVQDLPEGEEPVLRTVPEHTVPETLHIAAALRDARMEGQWSAPSRIVASAGRGTVHLDFTEATVDSGQVTVDARPNLAGIEITVPEGYSVTTEEATPGSSNVHDLTTAAAAPQFPRLHVVAYPGLGGIFVRHPKKGAHRRRGRRWLRRGKKK